jgi:hypothetical protein
MNEEPQERGYAFEKYLKSLFEAFSLQPREVLGQSGNKLTAILY